MIKKLKLFFTPKNVLFKLLRLRYRGMLYEEGWFEAACYYQSINKNKEPIPWWTYSLNDFLLPRLHNSLEIFEYGSGNSTLYLAKKVKHITSIEHNKEFFNYLRKKIPQNVTLKFKKLDKYNGNYSKAILEEDKNFDLIIIDGRDRVNCIYNAIQKLKSNGIILLDDSQREYYKEGINFLLKNGFKHIYFTGVSAGTYKKKATSIFYKDDNWLNI